MVKDEDFVGVVKILLDTIFSLAEQQAAMGAALQKRGLVTPDDLQSSLEEFQQTPRSQKAREMIEKLSLANIGDILGNFDGPVQ
jgi:hypothetical protein